MLRRYRVFVLWLIAALLVPLALAGSASQKKLRALLLQHPHKVQVGDWVFRSGVSADSRLIKSVSHSRFSHIGMVVQTQPQIWIAHATTDDDPARPNQVLITQLAEFAAVERADAVAIARPRFLNAEQRTATARHVAARQGQAFVLSAREKSPFYCTTLLLDAVQQQMPSFQPQWHYLDVPVFRGHYLFPQAFLPFDLEWIDHSLAVVH
ncbi:MAG: YiiX/YebB-like N1pC/P60 family cysteine hydrolase [Brachymonas sp.]|nr:YiiX/YebB-like N1pC/P60 family cysteine hydrolase [Brachymonas sp.]